ncbi:Phosphatidylinositol-3-phosphatase myotubularin-1 [Diplonema papillatum]|nr:Phosphatidylinositol-3-phosphatase myotubularin-1 [Diplonema papillatum]
MHWKEPDAPPPAAKPAPETPEKPAAKRAKPPLPTPAAKTPFRSVSGIRMAIFGPSEQEEGGGGGVGGCPAAAAPAPPEASVRKITTGRLLLTSYRVMLQEPGAESPVFQCPVGCISQATVKLGKGNQLKAHRRAIADLLRPAPRPAPDNPRPSPCATSHPDAPPSERCSPAAQPSSYSGHWAAVTSVFSTAAKQPTAPSAPPARGDVPGGGRGGGVAAVESDEEAKEACPSAVVVGAAREFFVLELQMRTGGVACTAGCSPGFDTGRPVARRPLHPTVRLLKEYARMGVEIPEKWREIAGLGAGEGVGDPGVAEHSRWRLSDVNVGFGVCGTYPELLAVPHEASDELLRQAAPFRARSRFPVLSYRCKETGATISRCSQPLVGVLSKRNRADEKLVHLISHSVKKAAAAPPNNNSSSSSGGGGNPNNNSSSSNHHHHHHRGAPPAPADAKPAKPAPAQKHAKPAAAANAADQPPRFTLFTRGSASEKSKVQPKPVAEPPRAADPEGPGAAEPGGRRPAALLPSLSGGAAFGGGQKDGYFADVHGNQSRAIARDSLFYIMDLRPRGNALANQIAKGGGHETSNYANSKVLFCGIQNIHAVQDSMQRVQRGAKYHSGRISSLLRDDSDSDDGADSVHRPGHLIEKVSRELQCSKDTGPDEVRWVQLLRSIIAASLEIANLIREHQSSVLVHCSDGWDRTPQVTALSQILLDPHSRTIDGFFTLIEKEWVAGGHQFSTRCNGIKVTSPASQGLNNHQLDTGSENELCCATVLHNGKLRPAIGGAPGPGISPTFVQWLTCVAQLVDQHPRAFMFSKRLLWVLAESHASGRHFSFLCNSDFERHQLGVYDAHPAAPAGYNQDQAPPGLFCPWTDLWHEHGDALVNFEYDSKRYPGMLKDVDFSLRKLDPWILPHAGPQTTNDRKTRQDLERQRAGLEDVIRLQEEEMQRLLDQVKVLEERYTEDVGHRPVEVREAHPGGRSARLQPIVEDRDGREVVTKIEDEGDPLDDEDGSGLVMVSHMGQTGHQELTYESASSSPGMPPSDSYGITVPPSLISKNPGLNRSSDSASDKGLNVDILTSAGDLNSVEFLSEWFDRK